MTLAGLPLYSHVTLPFIKVALPWLKHPSQVSPHYSAPGEVTVFKVKQMR